MQEQDKKELISSMRRKRLKKYALTALALVIGIIAAWCGRSLLSVAVICCAMVFVTEIFLV